MIYIFRILRFLCKASPALTVFAEEQDHRDYQSEKADREGRPVDYEGGPMPLSPKEPNDF